jgi:hypothetical protein
VSKFIEQFFSEQFSWAVTNFFADVSSKTIALADPVLRQPDMEGEMVSPPVGAYIPSFMSCHVLPDLPVPGFWDVKPCHTLPRRM